MRKYRICNYRTPSVSRMEFSTDCICRNQIPIAIFTLYITVFAAYNSLYREIYVQPMESTIDKEKLLVKGISIINKGLSYPKLLFMLNYLKLFTNF